MKLLLAAMISFTIGLALLQAQKIEKVSVPEPEMICSVRDTVVRS